MYNQKLTDEVLWQQFKAGNTVALGCIFDRYVNTLMGYGKLLTQDDALIEDSIQDVFVSLWEKRTNLGKVISLRHYLCSSLRRRLLRKLRTKRKLQANEIEFKSNETPAEISYETWLLQQQTDTEIKNALQQLIAELTPQQKKVIYLKFYEHLSYDEVAALMKINKRTVYNISSAALRQLHKSIKSKPQLKTILHLAISILLILFIF